MIVVDQSGGEKAAAKTIAGHLVDFKRPQPTAMSIVAFFSIELPSRDPRDALHFGLVGSDEWRLLNNPATNVRPRVFQGPFAHK
jgi:hypothetical protein